MIPFYKEQAETERNQTRGKWDLSLHFSDLLEAEIKQLKEVINIELLVYAISEFLNTLQQKEMRIATDKCEEMLSSNKSSLEVCLVMLKC